MLLKKRYNENNKKLEAMLIDEDVLESKENLTCAKIAQVQNKRNKNAKRIYSYYNLDIILEVISNSLLQIIYLQRNKNYKYFIIFIYL